MGYNMLFGLVFVMLAAKANALRCYNCTWNDQAIANTGHADNCQGPIVGSEHAIECPSNKPFCFVQNVRTVIPSLSINSVTIVRSCSEFNLETCIDLTIATTCTTACRTDLCNTGNNSTQVVINIMVLLVTMFTSIIIIN